MTTLNRYILTELTKNFLVGFFIFISILFISVCFYVINVVVPKGATFETVVMLLGLTCLTMFPLAIPLAYLFSTAAVYSKMTQNNEIVFLKSIGTHPLRYIYLPIFLSIPLCICMLKFNADINPKVQTTYYTIYRKNLMEHPLKGIMENSFADIGNHKIYISKIDRRNNRIKGVKIYQLRNNQMVTSIIADEGTLQRHEKNLLFNLQNGKLYLTNLKNIQEITTIKFHKFNFKIPYESEIIQTRNLKELTNKELKKEIKNIHNPARKTFLTELNMRNVISFTPFLFCIFALPVAIKHRISYRYFGFGITLLTAFIYYLLLMCGVAIYERYENVTSLIMWLPNFVILILSGFFSITPNRC